MLYGIGMVLLLLSGAFVGGSVVVPVAIAGTGITLMIVGRRPNDGKQTRV